MKINAKISVAAGIMLFAAAAFLCISLMASFFGTAQLIPDFLSVAGVVLSGAYGYSSCFAVVFLLAAAILVMLPKWNSRRGLYLFVSVLPFFTIVLTEKLCGFIVSGVNVPYMGLKIGAILVAAVLLIAIEYLVAGFFADLLFDRGGLSGGKSSVPVYEDEILPEAVSEATAQAEEFDELEEHEAVPALMRKQNNEPDESLSERIEVNILEPEAQPDVQDTVAQKLEAEIFPDVFGLTDEEAAYLGAPFLPEETQIQNADKTDVQAIESYVPAAEKCDEVLSEENDNDTLFVDLNWKKNRTLPVRPYTDEDAAEDEIVSFDEEAEFEEGETDGDVFMEDENFDEEFEDEGKNAEFEEIPAETCRPPVLKRGVYRVPADGLLNSYPDGEYWIIDSETQRAASILKETLSEFKISAEVTGIRKGPVITMFEILPAPGVKLTRIVALQDNIALRLAASSVRIVAPIPGKHAVGIEVPNKDRFIVSFRELIDNDVPGFKKMEIPVVLGKDITGEAQILDLASTPHLLIAGSTGSGKSVCVNSMILSILYKRSPQEVKMILIDPKIVELKLYNDIPHLLTPVITEPKKAFQALQYCLCEMERRYSLLDKMGVRDIKSFNRRITERNLANEKLAYIVVIIDEFADLMATTGKELESTVARLAAMSRAVGVHLVLATQRPSIDVITGLIKANIPTRIAFMVASKMDSRIIIDQVGAEKLLGRGDMLYSSAVDPFPVRIQGTYVSEEEVERVVEYVKQYGEPEYIDEEIFFDEEEESVEPSLFGGEDDPLYDKALEIVLQAGKASASYIQRRLKIGYNRAARLVEDMEQRGIVGPANGSKPREVVHVPR